MITEAILKLNPDLTFSVEENDDSDQEKFNAIIWFNGVDETNAVVVGEPEGKPTWAEVEAELTILRAEYAAKDYSRKRKEAYDQLNQFELIGEDSINGTTNHKNAILEIKAKYPKE
jgi:hypothetical protein